MVEYIERERIEKFFDGIYDCADLTFEPNDHCCASDDCAHCKWYETKNAIQKRILSIPAAEVRPVIKAKWVCTSCKGFICCNNCGNPVAFALKNDGWHYGDYCPKCGASMA